MRYFFIDIFRFIAILLMIQGHTFDALLQNSVRSASWFPIHDYLHGYVAAMFLFGSGIAFVISTFKKWDLYISFSPETKKRICRYIGLIIIGYFLHLPIFSFSNVVFGLTENEYLQFVQSDALHCIGVSLLFTQLLVLVSKSQKLLFIVSASILLFTLVATPYFWNYKFAEIFPLWLASYFSFQLKSWFPLFPWIGYLFSGIFIGYLFNKYREKNINQFFIWLTVISFIIIIISINFGSKIESLYPPHDIWKSGGINFITQTAVLSLILSFIFLVTRKIKSIPKIILTTSRQSLLIYILHLLILYGSVISSGLKLLYNRSLPLENTLTIYLAILILIYYFLQIWESAKKEYSPEMKKMGLISTVALIIVFVIN
ncbi:MAG: DUF1624 domain-containing protein [Ignavibacteria bacterium]|nr:DUF1624 domain-containing protein [Ignavibacteria bacterium]